MPAAQFCARRLREEQPTTSSTMVLFTIVALGIAFYAPLLLLWKWKVFSSSPLNKVPGPPAASWLKGHMGLLFNRNGQQFQDDILQKYGPIVKLKGLFSVPQIFVSDTAALHTILIKEHDIFEEPASHLIGNTLLFGPGLISVAGERHKRQRKLLNPAFSTAHLRETLPIMYKVINRLRTAMAQRLREDEWSEMDVLNWIGRAALELVAQAGLGCSLDPLDDDVVNPCGEAVKTVIPALVPLVIVRRFLPILVKIGPPQFRRWVIERLPSKSVTRLRNIVDIIDVNAKRIVAEKVEAIRRGDHQVDEGRDILSRLVRANLDASEEDALPEEEIIGQVATLVFAATDTTSSTLARLLHLLAYRSDVQEKLRQEIVAARKEKGDLTFDELFELPYLEAVCRETLRLYAPVSFVSKTARADTVLPLRTPIRCDNGDVIEKVPVPQGTNVIVGIGAVNRSKELWGDDAEEWKPERWLSPLPESLLDARVPGVYSNMLTFLGGGRACIGFKFSQCEMKVVLTVLLESFVFEPSDTKVEWHCATVTFPSVGDAHRPQLPLKVKLLR